MGVGRRGEHRHAVSRYVTICYVTMLCDYVMSALRGDQARTARCLRRGSAARRDQELPPARVCRAPISGTIALLNIQHTPANMHNIRRVIWITDLRL